MREKEPKVHSQPHEWVEPERICVWHNRDAVYGLDISEPVDGYICPPCAVLQLRRALRNKPEETINQIIANYLSQISL